MKGGGWAEKLGAGVERREEDTQVISAPPNVNHGKHGKQRQIRVWKSTKVMSHNHSTHFQPGLTE